MAEVARGMEGNAKLRRFPQGGRMVDKVVLVGGATRMPCVQVKHIIRSEILRRSWHIRLWGWVSETKYNVPLKNCRFGPIYNTPIQTAEKKRNAMLETGKKSLGGEKTSVANPGRALALCT